MLVVSLLSFAIGYTAYIYIYIPLLLLLLLVPETRAGREEKKGRVSLASHGGATAICVSSIQGKSGKRGLGLGINIKSYNNDGMVCMANFMQSNSVWRDSFCKHHRKLAVNHEIRYVGKALKLIAGRSRIRKIVIVMPSIDVRSEVLTPSIVTFIEILFVD